MQPLLTENQIALGKLLRKNGASWRDIGKELGVDHHTAHAYIDPSYREQRTAMIVFARGLRRMAHQQALLNGVSKIAIVRGMAQ